LFGDVNMDGTSRRKRYDGRQLLRPYCPQAVRRYSQIGCYEPANRCTARFHDPREALEIRHEAALACTWLPASESAMGIKRRQQRQRDASVGRSGCDTPGELTRIGERHGRLVLMQVVKLTDAGEAGLEHLRERERRDGLELIRIDPLHEAIHELTPGPEAVLSGTAALRQPGDGALKRVAVQVGEPGDARRMTLIPITRLDIRLDGGDNALVACDADAARPTSGQQGRFEPEPQDPLPHLRPAPTAAPRVPCAARCGWSRRC